MSVSQVECETVVDAGVALLRAPSVALKNFRVIGVISNVLLVVDTATEGSYIIKVLLACLVHLCVFVYRIRGEIIRTVLCYIVCS